MGNERPKAASVFAAHLAQAALYEISEAFLLIAAFRHISLFQYFHFGFGCVRIYSAATAALPCCCQYGPRRTAHRFNLSPATLIRPTRRMWSPKRRDLMLRVSAVSYPPRRFN